MIQKKQLINEAASNYSKGKYYDDYSEQFAAEKGFCAGIEFATKWNDVGEGLSGTNDGDSEEVLVKTDKGVVRASRYNLYIESWSNLLPKMGEVKYWRYIEF